MRDISRIISGVLATLLFANACAADGSPSMSAVLRTFEENRSAFDTSVAVIASLELEDDRVTFRDSDSDAEHPDIANMFKLRPVSVETVIVYRNYSEGLLIDYVIYASGLSVSGESWSIVYEASGSRGIGDPAIASLPSCEGVDLRDIVENDSIVLSAECRLAELWKLEYTAN